MKDYKKILEGVVSIINTTEKSDIGFANICSYIGKKCPELKESEDERIRNFISNELACLRAADEKGTVRYNELTEAISWLEKQGEQKPAWSEEDEINLDGILNCYKSMDIKWRNWLKSLKDRVGCEANCTTTKEWSEEDETTKNNISHIIRQYDKISKRENKPCWYIGDCLLWMQNIKDRVLPKQELSDEEIESCAREAEALNCIILAKHIRQLKSLRPQAQWKPSKEQMEALKSSTYCQNEQMSKVLFELYQDLKKLMEE